MIQCLERDAAWVLGLLVVASFAPALRAVEVASYSAGTGSLAFSPEFDGWDGAETGLSGSVVKSVLDSTNGSAPAWQITDASPGEPAPRYTYPLFGSDLTNARTHGWRMTANARLVTASQAAPTMGIAVFFDSAAYLVQVNSQGGQLYATLWDSISSPFVITHPLASGAGVNAYHDYEVRWSPTENVASFYFDGEFVLDWDGLPSTHGADANVFQFGASTYNGSGTMNFRSVLFETLDTSPASQGDYNGDGRVDAADYAVWRNNRGTRTGVGDGNGDGFVGQPDYSVWRQNYGRALTAPVSPASPAPEPGQGLLLSMAVLSGALAVRPVR